MSCWSSRRERKPARTIGWSSASSTRTRLRIAQDDMNVILGGNAARVFELEVSHTRLFKPV